MTSTAWVSEFADNRPIANAQRKLQAAVDQSPEVQDLAQLQARVNNSPRVQAQAQLQAMIDTSPRQVSQRQQDLGEEELQMQVEPGTIQRQGLESDELVQGKMDPVQRQGASDGDKNHTGLPDSLKGGLEQLSGMDLSALRVHRNSAKPAELKALAYAQGKHIHLGPGQEKHLPHEGWHAVQQMQGRVKPTIQAKGVQINDDEGLEKEADVMGAKAAVVPASKSFESECKDWGTPLQHQGEYKPGSSPRTQLLKPVVQQQGRAATGTMQGDVIQRKYLDQEDITNYSNDYEKNFPEKICKNDIEAKIQRLTLNIACGDFFKNDEKDLSQLQIIRTAVDFLDNFVINNLDILDESSGRKEALDFLFALHMDLKFEYKIDRGGSASKPPKDVKEPLPYIDKEPSIKPSNAKKKNKKNKNESKAKPKNEKEARKAKQVPSVKIKAPKHEWKPGKDLKISPEPAIKAEDKGIKYLIEKGTKLTKSTAVLGAGGTTYETKIEVQLVNKGTDKIYEVSANKLWVIGDDLPNEFPTSGTFYTLDDIERIAKFTTATIGKANEISIAYFDYAGGEVLVKASEISAQKSMVYSLVKYFDKTYKVDPNKLLKKSAQFEKTIDLLFPIGGPKSSHIEQTNLGDCYFQSVIIEIAKSNPGHLQDMMREDNGTVVVRFYQNNAAVYIKVNKTLPQSATGEPLYNAGENWVRFLQKAYAVFAQKYGKYGAALEMPDKEGYEGIVGGVGCDVYKVFYGSAVLDAQRTETNYTPENKQKNVTENNAIITKLYEFKNQKSVQKLNLTAGANYEEHLKRLKKLIPLLTVPVEDNKKIKMKSGMNPKGNMQIGLFNLAFVKLIVENDKKKSQKDVSEQARLVLGRDEWAKLEKTSVYNAANELLHNLSTAGSDSSSGDRFIYSGHAYAIVEVKLKNNQDQPANDKDVSDNKIDLFKSKVTLRNPHRENAPHLKGDEAMDQQNEPGRFAISLDQFLRNFTHLDYAQVLMAQKK